MGKLSSQNKISREFSRFSKSYQELNSIQKRVAKELISKVEFKPQTILDLGSGAGEVYKNIDWNFKSFTGVDISESMCQIHPKSDRVKLLNCSFEEEFVYRDRFDIVISSSAIQWSQNLDRLFKNISTSTDKIAFAIFTSNTFRNLHNFLNLNSPIYSKDEILSNLERYFHFSYQIECYQLEFNNSLKMLEYIKRSGVSSGEKRLSYREIKRVIDSYPLNYLEFETIFISN